MDKFNHKMCNPLWYVKAEKLALVQLLTLEEAFKRGILPLGDMYGDHCPRWVNWKSSVLTRLEELRT